MIENVTVKLSNELSRSNLKSLGFFKNVDTSDYEYICQDKYFKFATKKVTLCVTRELDKVYAVVNSKDYNDKSVCVARNEITLHFNINTTTELISLVRMLKSE
jgi:hypothetical protein